mgnify:FL=1
MKRLGMWNRLAIVAMTLATFITPSWVVLNERAEIVERQSVGYRACLKAALDPRGDGTLNVASCSENWFGDHTWYPGWQEWWQLLGATFLLCVILYFISWAIVAVAKWVWRGRATSQN